MPTKSRNRRSPKRLPRRMKKKMRGGVHRRNSPKKPITRRKVADLTREIGQGHGGSLNTRIKEFVRPRWMDDVDRTLSQWKLYRARAGRPVPRFTGGNESCLLVHSRRRVALELVGMSNGWYRWSADFEKREKPATGMPPSWVETDQNWDADWLDFEKPALTLQGEMLRVRRDAQQDLLPGDWRLSVFQGTVSIQNGVSWIHLTERGFRCAHRVHILQPPSNIPQRIWEATYEVSHGRPLGGAPRSRALSALAPGPWSSLHDRDVSASE